MLIVKTFALYIITAVAEIVGCYLPYVWLKKNGSPWLLVPAALSLALFAWLLTLHPTASGRVYAAYGGVYIAVAMAWLWKVGIHAIFPHKWLRIFSIMSIHSTSVSVTGLPLISCSVESSQTGLPQRGSIR